MSKLSLWMGLVGLPLAIPLLLVGLLTPSYVPSGSLASAAVSTPSPALARRRMKLSFVGRCRGSWNLDRLESEGRAVLHSWENDAGLFARTEILCRPGRPCTVYAQALLATPLPSQLGGKPVPTRFWGCGVVPPTWRIGDRSD